MTLPTCAQKNGWLRVEPAAGYGVPARGFGHGVGRNARAKFRANRANYFTSRSCSHRLACRTNCSGTTPVPRVRIFLTAVLGPFSRVFRRFSPFASFPIRRGSRDTADKRAEAACLDARQAALPADSAWWDCPSARSGTLVHRAQPRAVPRARLSSSSTVSTSIALSARDWRRPRQASTSPPPTSRRCLSPRRARAARRRSFRSCAAWRGAGSRFGFCTREPPARPHYAS